MAAILVASPDGELRRMVAREAAEGGHQVDFAADAIEAAMLVKGRLPALVVADQRMPAPGALALLARLRAEPATRFLHVILIGEEGAAAPAKPDAAATFLPRPLGRVALSETLGPLLDAARAPAAGPATAAGAGAPAARAPADWPLQMRRLCHDLNNPLAVIMGHLEMISEQHRDLPEGALRRLAEMRRSAEDMKARIRRAGVEAKESSGEAPGGGA